MADLIIISPTSGTRIDIKSPALETVAQLKARISAQAASKHPQGKALQPQNMVLVWRGSELSDSDPVLAKVAHQKDNVLLLQWSHSRFAETAAGLAEEAKVELAGVEEQARASRLLALNTRTDAIAHSAAEEDDQNKKMVALRDAGRERLKTRIASVCEIEGDSTSCGMLDHGRHQAQLHQLKGMLRDHRVNEAR
jgi:hypothetical protein